jgi:hypothetical protein
MANDIWVHAQMIELHKFLDDQMKVAVALPEQIKSAFDREDLPLTEALDITASIRKSSECLEAVLSDVDPVTLDEPTRRLVRTLRSIWREMYVLAQVGSDRLMNRDAAKLA